MCSHNLQRSYEKSTSLAATMSVDISAFSNLDTIFAEIGEVGFYQITSYLLIIIPNVLSSTYVISYMFTGKSLDYR